MTTSSLPPRATAPSGTPLPTGTWLTPAAGLARREGGLVLLGGTPRRLLRLTPTGRDVVAGLLAGEPVATISAATVGRRLVDAGLARPHPPADAAPLRVAVIVPVCDRVPALRRCLAALGSAHPVLVVDDGSADPDAIAAVVSEAGARLVRRPVCGGPAAARNSGLAAITADLCAFVDSDVEVSPGWLEPLLAHFGDPAVGAVAPRIVPAPSSPSLIARYLRARSPLDHGAVPSPVRPGSPIAYVPTAALVVRPQALGAFDEALRYGEDVDAVWRMVDAGWSVRYEPDVVVHHREPEHWPALWRRRHAYGSAAGPLARRHPGRLAHLQAAPLPALSAVSVVAAPLPLAAALVTATTIVAARRLAGAGLGSTDARSVALAATGQATLGLGRYLSSVGAPLLLIAGRRRRRLLLLVAVTQVEQWWRRRPAVDPVRFSAAALSDDIAYSSGVWRGAWRARTWAPLLPRLSASAPTGARRKSRTRTSWAS